MTSKEDRFSTADLVINMTGKHQELEKELSYIKKLLEEERELKEELIL